MAAVASRPGTRVRRPISALVLAGIGTVVVAICAVIVRDGRVSAPERRVFEGINDLPEWLYWPMWVLQLLGLLATPLVVAAVALVLRKYRLAIAAAVTVALKLVIEKLVIKQVVDRQRPGATEPDAVIRHVPAIGPSFPSGHAIVAFTLAMLLTPYLSRRWNVLVWTLAVLVCVARVYLGAHNPLDVVAGAGAGLFLGGLLTWIVGVPVRDRRR